MSQKVGELYYDLTLETSGLISQQRAVAASTKATADSLERIGESATRAGAEAQKGMAQAATGAKGAASAMQSAGAAAKDAGGRFTDTAGKLREANGQFVRTKEGADAGAGGLRSFTAAGTGFAGGLTQIAGAVGAYAAALWLVRQSDAFTKMNAQLKLATESTRELAIAQADVRRIAQEAQTDISAVAMLYAKVSSSTKELGTSQKTVADITRTVSLALKVSGASAQESSSAIMQLGQAFASGVLRGDEFNSVNEAAPRLMKALADGIGVPIGQLRAMAEAGKLTSEVLANALPKALKDLEQEAKQIQTISGAFQQLSNEMMLFIGQQTTASGAAKATADVISLLATNIDLLAAAALGFAAAKLAGVLLTAGEAAVVAARSIAAAGTAAATANRAMTAIGGPIGLISTLLGLGATAWMMWGNSADDASKQAEGAIEASGREIIASLDKQNAKLRERLALAKAGNVDAAKSGSKDAERLASTLGEINALKAKGNAITGSDRIQLAELEGRYRDISAALKTNKGLTEEIAAVGQQSKASEWAVKYATDIERVNAEIAKAKKELGDAFTPELEQRIRAKIIPPKKAAAEKKTADQKFDDAGYLAGLEAASVDVWAKVAVVEDEAKRKNDKLLAEKKISRETHEQAITLITADAVKARQAISESEISAAAEAGLKRMEQRDKGRQVAQETIAGVNPIDALRLEEEQKIVTLEEFRLLDLANTQIYEDAKLAIKKTTAEKIKAVEDDLRSKEQAVQSAQLMAYSGMFGSIADLTKTFGDKQSGAYKAMFAVSKAFAIADSIIKIQQGIAGAAALPFPLNMPAIGAVIAATSGIISTIGGTNFAGGRQYGGVANSGNLYRVNEKGAPEMFTAANGSQYMLPTQSGRVTAADQVGGGSVQWTINVNNTAGGTTASASIDDQSKTVNIAIAQVASQIRENSGPVWSALRGASNVTGRM